MNFAEMSDEELEKLASPDPLNFSAMSDDELEKIAGPAPAEPEHWAKSIARSGIDTVLPVAGAIGGGLLATPETLGLGTIPGAALGYAAGKQGARLLNHYVLGDKLPAETIPDVAMQTGSDLLEGATAEMGGMALGKGLEVAAPYVGNAIRGTGKKIGSFAEKAALNATGATGKQASEFADDAGRQLLDRKIIQFGDDQANIASRASRAVEQANAQIDDSLRTLESNGVKVDSNRIYETIRSKIDDLRGDPSQADVANMLEKELENLVSAADVRGSTDFAVGAVEKMKRGYNRKAGNWADPEKGMVGKEMYQTYRGAVEDAAQAADPATAALFKEGKESYGLLRPIQEAADRRAATTSQSPVGGLLDMVTSGVAGIPAAIGRRLGAPRISSSVAVTADKVSKMLIGQPKMAALAKRDPVAFKAAVTNLTNRLSSHMTESAPRAADLNELDRDSSTPAWDKSPYPDGGDNKPPSGLDIEAQVKSNPQRFGKFAPVLQNAASRGPQGISATHFILQQTNPDYRKMLNMDGDQ